MKMKLPAVIALTLILATGAVAQQGLVKGIAVEGTKIIEKTAVMNRLETKVGFPADTDKIAEDIRSIYKMGFFSDVRVEHEETAGGIILKYIVKEKPYIREVRFKGNKDSSEDDLKALVMTKRYSFLDERKVSGDVEKIKKHYTDKGYHFVIASSKIEPSKDRPGDVALLFEITEGKKIRIEKIIFNGAKAFSQWRLKRVIDTKEKSIFSWITKSGTYKSEDLKEDFERLRDFYGEEGYLQGRVTGHKVYMNKDQDGLIVELEVFEGKQFTVSDVRLGGDAEKYAADLNPLLKQKKDKTFRKSNIRADLTTVGDFMGDKGFAYANVEPDLDVSEEKAVVAIKYEVAKGKLVHINRILVEGNNKTRDKVVRRELNLAEGELYNASKIKKSKDKINKLGFFDDVAMVPQRVEYETPENKDEDLMDLLVKVKERPTGSFTFGVGYSSLDKIIGSLQISQNNLFGTSQKLSGSAQFSSKTQNYTFSYVEPWLFDYPVSGGIDIFNTEKKYTDYTKTSKGFALRSGYRINDDWTLSGGYRYEKDTVKDIPVFSSLYLYSQLGTKTTSAVYAALSRDTRNDLYYPTEGSSFTISSEVAGGVLGGDNYYYNMILDATKFYELPWSHVLAFHGQYGFIDGYGGREIPIYQRFFLGGINNLRGFETRSVGPRDPWTGEVIGGSKEVYANIEYVFPIIKEAGVRGVFFFDAGNAFNRGVLPSTLRTSVGAGIRWYSPMGPLRLEWGKNISPYAWEKPSKFEFSIGTNF